MADLSGIWLEVSNIRFNPSADVEVQLKGDKADKEPEWWPVHPKPPGDKNEIQKAVFSGLDKKRVVLARLEPNGDENKDKLHCSLIRIQHADPGSR